MSWNSIFCVLPNDLLADIKKLGETYSSDYYSSTEVVMFLEQNSFYTCRETIPRAATILFDKEIKIFTINGIEGKNSDLWFLPYNAVNELLLRAEKWSRFPHSTIGAYTSGKYAWPKETLISFVLEMKKETVAWAKRINPDEFGVFCLYEWGKF